MHCVSPSLNFRYSPLVRSERTRLQLQCYLVGSPRSPDVRPRSNVSHGSHLACHRCRPSFAIRPRGKHILRNISIYSTEYSLGVFGNPALDLAKGWLPELQYLYYHAVFLLFVRRDQHVCQVSFIPSPPQILVYSTRSPTLLWIALPWSLVYSPSGGSVPATRGGSPNTSTRTSSYLNWSFRLMCNFS